MAYLLLVAVFGGTIAIAVATWLYLRNDDRGFPAELAARQRALSARLTALATSLPARPRTEVAEASHPATAEAWALLLAGRPRAALAEAERIVADGPADPLAHLLLARALLASGEGGAAASAARRAASLGASGPELDFTRGLAGYLVAAAAPAAHGLDTPYPTLLTPYELFVLELERHRQRGERAAGLWLANLGNATLSNEQILEVVSGHLSAYCDCLEHLLDAAEARPGFAEAAYHAARLGVKLSMIDPARAVFEALEPLMSASAEDASYQRDLAALRDETISLAPPPPPTAEGARRSTALKILK